MAILSTSTTAQFYTIYNDFLKKSTISPPKGTNLQATIYNIFASSVYILQPEFGPNNNLQNTPPPDWWFGQGCIILQIRPGFRVERYPILCRKMWKPIHSKTANDKAVHFEIVKDWEYFVSPFIFYVVLWKTWHLQLECIWFKLIFYECVPIWDNLPRISLWRIFMLFFSFHISVCGKVL